MMRALFSAALLLVCLSSVAQATNYYVDPTGGNDDNAGTSTGAAWRTPPGTRTANNSGFLSGGTWGQISTGNKIACGDTIYLRPSRTQTSAEGGAWRLAPDYYANGCSTSSRMTIRVATTAEWPGATAGAFTINGSGVTVGLDGYNGDPGQNPALIAIVQSWVQVLGSASQPIRLLNSAFNGLFIGRYGNATVGARVDWLEVNGAGYHGAAVCYANNWQVSNITVQNVKNGGITTGCSADNPVYDGGFVNATVFNSGCGSPACPYPSCCPANRNGGAEDAFNFSGAYRIWCVRCTAHDTGERGFSGGSVNDNNLNADQFMRYRDIISYSNGLNADPNKFGAAFLPSGSDWYPNGFVTRTYVVGFLGWGNQGCWGAYGGAWAEAWHATCFNNTSESYSFGADDRFQGVYNSMGQQSPIFRSSTSNGALPQGTFIPGVMNNCLRSPSLDSQTLFQNHQTPAWPNATATFDSPPAYISTSNGNKIGRAACNGGSAAVSPWVSPNVSTFTANDYRLVNTATAIDAGRFLLLANGAGTSSNTLAVKANTVSAPGGNSNPQNYLIGPSSFLDPPVDTIQIQNATCATGSPTLQPGQAKVVSMTATTITLDRTCSWTNGAGVHLPWNGSAPDMGAFEFGNGGPPAPTLLSVEPVTP